jgi:hypothetical protein
VAATESSPNTLEARPTLGCGILLAALALPTLQTARADTPPDRAQISYKYLDYLDFQPGWDRIGVQANAISALLPIAGKGGSDWGYAWIPVLGPILGGLAGAWLFKALGGPF